MQTPTWIPLKRDYESELLKMKLPRQEELSGQFHPLLPNALKAVAPKVTSSEVSEKISVPPKSGEENGPRDTMSFDVTTRT